MSDQYRRKFNFIQRFLAFEKSSEHYYNRDQVKSRNIPKSDQILDFFTVSEAQYNII